MRKAPFAQSLPWVFIAFLAVGLVNSTTAPAWGEEATPVSEADLTYFYKTPSSALVARLITHYEVLRTAEKPAARPPLMGFFAASFQRYPGDIDKMIPESLSPAMMELLAVSLRLAGQQAKAEALVAILKTKDAVVPDLATIPSSLDGVVALGPSEFDLLWGASFATGDAQYSSKILTRFVDIANVGDNADDLVRIVRTMESGKVDNWLVDKRGEEGARELIPISTALWALHSNAQQHLFVQNMVNDYIMAHPSEPAAKALVSLAREYGYYQLAKLASVTEGVPGKASVTINIAYFGQILDDLGRHAGSYPTSFEFADDQQRAVHDITGISKMLDPLTVQFSTSPQILLRLAVLHVIGFNLDVPNSFQSARAVFDKLLSLNPEDPQANYRYGAFLASTTRKGEGIPYLQKATNLGISDAGYWLGWSYEVAGNKAKAIETLEAYTSRVPSDRRAAVTLEAIRNDRVEFKTLKPGETPPSPKPGNP
jgi:hypothetical protein